MSMSGKFGPVGFKQACWVGQGGDMNRETGETISGICQNCNEWDAELVGGFCRDESCKAKREQLAVATGSAIKIIDGLPNGVKIFYTREGRQIIKT